MMKAPRPPENHPVMGIIAGDLPPVVEPFGIEPAHLRLPTRLPEGDTRQRLLGGPAVTHDDLSGGIDQVCTGCGAEVGDCVS